MTDTAASGKRSIPRSSVILLCLYAVYLVLTFIGAARHEIWYDEAQAWNIVKYNDIAGVIDFMKYEGHPPLWHFVLYPFAHMGLPADILPFISWFISGAAAGLLLWKAPFRPVMKGIVLFSGGFIFYNSVISRVYCLATLVLVLIAIVYKSRDRHPVVYGLLIALLANTHLMMSGLVGILGIYMIIDLFRLWKTSSRKMNILRLVGLAIAGVGVITLIIPLLGCMSANQTVSSKAQGIGIFTILSSLVKAPGSITANAIFDHQLSFLAPTLSWTIATVISIHIILAIVLFRHYKKHFIIMMVFTAFYTAICCVIWITLPPRALLMLFTYAIIYWFALDTEKPVYKEPKPMREKTSEAGQRIIMWFRGVDRQFDRNFCILFCIYTAMTIPMGSYQLIKDYFTDFSCSRAFAEFVRSELPDDSVFVVYPNDFSPSYNACLPEYEFYSVTDADFWLYNKHLKISEDFVPDYQKVYNDLKNYKHLYLLDFSGNTSQNALFKKHLDSSWVYINDLNIEVTEFDLDKEILPLIDKD